MRKINSRLDGKSMTEREISRAQQRLLRVEIIPFFKLQFRDPEVKGHMESLYISNAGIFF